jgi:DNA polymerase III delta subunit
MHSNWQIWDFFTQTSNRGLLSSFEGVLSLGTFDSTSLKMVKDYLLKDCNTQAIHYKFGAEITLAWLQDEFVNLSLFNSQESFFIHHAHEMSQDCQELVCKLEITGRFLILSFPADNQSFKKIEKDKKTEYIKIDSPKFWENNKLLDFIIAYYRLRLSYDAKNWILSNIENDLISFSNSCTHLKLNYFDKNEIDLAMVKDLLQTEKLDHFHLASLLAKKKFKEFYELILKFEGDYERVRMVFMFLQSHLLKISDPSYLNKKSKLSQYDKEIQSCSIHWRLEQIIEKVEMFNLWEIMAKKKDAFLWHQVKLKHQQLHEIKNP